MNRKVAIGVLVLPLLASGLLVGVSSGTSSRIAEPTVLELKFREENGKFFALDGGDGVQTGQLTWLKRSLWDTDGGKVGSQRIECTAITDDRGWICTFVSAIKDGPHTDKGTVVAVGIYNGFAAFSTFAVTGGTGAYDGVGGRAKQVEEDHTFTFSLTP